MVCYHSIVLSCVVSQPASLVLWDSLSYRHLTRSPFLLLWRRGSSIVANKKPVRHIHFVGLGRRKSYFDHIIQNAICSLSSLLWSYGESLWATLSISEAPSPDFTAGGGEGNRDRGRFWWTVSGHHQRPGSPPCGPQHSAAVSSQVWVCGVTLVLVHTMLRSPSSQRASLMCCH